MLYFIAEDESYYNSLSLEKLKKEYNKDKIITFPKEGEVTEHIKNASKTCFIAPYPPSAISVLFQNHSFFEVIYLQNTHGLLTSGQKELNIPETVVLKEKLGVDIHKPSFTLNNYGGASALRQSVLDMEKKIIYGLPVKGFMLTGIPGTGKSFFAKCVAGETGRLLIELNLSIFMERENGLQLLSNFFEFFKSSPGHYIIWIDEIEKMITDGDKSQQTLGLLLSKINDLNANSENSSVYLIATANNISGLASKNPEFFRNGRFDVLVFIQTPKQEDATTIFTIYIESYIKKFQQETIYYILKNLSLDKKPSSKSRASTIEQNIIKSIDINILTDFKKQSIDQIKKSVKKDIQIKEVLNKIGKEFEFKFDTSSFIKSTIHLYGEQRVTATRYTHTPAEIEYIVSDAFFLYYFSEEEINLINLANKYQPLQITMKDGIEKMVGVADKFIKI